MKVIQLPSNYLPDSLGGTEVYVHQLSTTMAEHGVECIVAHHSPTQKKPEGPLRYRVETLPKLRDSKRGELYSNSLGEEPPGFRELLERESPDLIHFHAFSLGAGCDHSRVARELRIPYIVTYHVPGMSCPRGTLLRWGKEICEGKLDLATCSACLIQRAGWPKFVAESISLSPMSAFSLPDGKWITTLSMKDLVKRWASSWEEFMNGAAHIIGCAKWCKEVLVLNGVPEGKVSVIRQALPGETRTRRLRLPLAQNRKIKIGLFGRVTKVKAPDLVLRVVQALNSRGVEAECEIVGPVYPHEKKWAERLFNFYQGLCVYHGRKTGQELTDWVRSMDLILLPGQWMETGPLVLLEAWDQGVPVVGVNAGGIREYLLAADLGSLTFEPDDILSAVQAVLRARTWESGEPPEVHLKGMDLLGHETLECYREAIAGREKLPKRESA